MTVSFCVCMRKTVMRGCLAEEGGEFVLVFECVFVCVCVCVSVMRGCLAEEGGELGFTAQVTCTWRNAHTSARSHKNEVIHLKSPFS